MPIVDVIVAEAASAKAAEFPPSSPRGPGVADPGAGVFS
jgi:hypothetical protein